MQVIGFFGNLFNQFGLLWQFISTPLGELNENIVVEPFKSSSIMGLLSVSLVATLIVLLVIHLIRLFIGG